MALYLLACRNEIIPGQETLSGRETITLGYHIIIEQEKNDENVLDRKLNYRKVKKNFFPHHELKKVW